MYLQLLPFFIMSGVPVLLMHIYDILGYMICSFVVEVYVDDFLAFVEAL